MFDLLSSMKNSNGIILTYKMPDNPYECLSYITATGKAAFDCNALKTVQLIHYFVCLWDLHWSKFLHCQNILEFNKLFPHPLTFSEIAVQWSAIDFVDIDNGFTENVSEHFVLTPRCVECCDIVAVPEGVDVTLDYCFKHAIVRLYYQFQINVSFSASFKTCLHPHVLLSFIRVQFASPFT